MNKKFSIRKLISFIVFVICIILLIYSSIKIIIWFINNKKTEQIKKSIKEITTVEFIKDEDDEDIMKVDFNNLLKENYETVAWINIPGTDIDYPVVQHNDNDYYLYHSFDNSYNGAGWVFMDYRNNYDFSDKNTVIYGHNMLNGTMFGTIKNTQTNDYLNNYKGNYYIYITTMKTSYIFEIFSSYHLDPTDDYIRTSFNDENDFNEWLMMVKNRSMNNYGVSVVQSDKILTLSSCFNLQERYAIHAKLISSKNY